MKKKVLAIALAVVLLAVMVGSSLAYFTDTDQVTNTFTVGSVLIDIYENGTITDKDVIEFEDPMLPVGVGTEVTVPAGSYYVLGDNRNHSGDSRDPQIGLVGKDALIGIQIARIPLGRFHKQ